MKQQIRTRITVIATVAVLGFLLLYNIRSLYREKTVEDSSALARNIDVRSPSTSFKETASKLVEDEADLLNSTEVYLNWDSGILSDPLAEQILLVNSILDLNKIDIPEEKRYVIAQLTATGKNILNALDARLSSVVFENDTAVFRVDDYPESIRSDFKSKFLKDLEEILGDKEYSEEILDSLKLYLRGFGDGAREVTIKSQGDWYHISDLSYPMVGNLKNEYLESGGVLHSDLQDIDLPDSSYLYFVDRAKNIRLSLNDGIR